jgi:hypothetical protein
MTDWWRGGPNEQSSSEAEIEVVNYIRTENRDPRLIAVQQLWVYLEMHKRERALSDADAADQALKDAKTLYENIVTEHPHFPPHLRSRLDNLKRELDALLPH